MHSMMIVSGAVGVGGGGRMGEMKVGYVEVLEIMCHSV